MTSSGRVKVDLRHLLEGTDRFVTAVEIVTGRGPITEGASRVTLHRARSLAGHPRIDALSLTDNPAGTAWLAPDTLATDLLSRGQDVIIHLACKDTNRNALQSRAWKLASEGFRNVLALSGDYPLQGFSGRAEPVFDIDSVGLLHMLSQMNEGRGIERPTGFFAGAVVTNHKLLEQEVMPQYFKLRKKVAHGAAFVINQIGYHARKDDELLRWMGLHGLAVPVLSNIYVLTLRAAQAFNADRVPGVVVTDALLALAERYGAGADRGRAFFHELAAKQVAIARGLGFRGAYLGGRLEVADIDAILDRADAYGTDDWRALAREVQFPYPGEFHYFERDETTGLSSERVNESYLASRRAARRRDAGMAYRLNHVVHGAVFEPDGILHGVARSLAERVDRGPPGWRKLTHRVEHATKLALFGCRDCGDCSLPEIAYLCPESQCVKNQRNGPCGGTRRGLCEIGEKRCIWVRAYERLQAYDREETMLEGQAVGRDGALRGTSAWSNALLGRDHHGRHDGSQP